MTIEKLPSGSYRIRQQYKGKRYTVVVPFKPTQKEALRLISDRMEESAENTAAIGNETVKAFIQKFIDYCEKNGRSPSTIRGYSSILRNMDEEFLKSRFSEITQEDIQNEVDRYAQDHSPKSVDNFNGLIRSAMTKYRPRFDYSIKLPSKEVKAEYEPSTKDIQRILEYTENTKYGIVFCLCALGLRRGEAIAITAADLDDNDVLTIDKDIVQDKNNAYVLKDKPKTEESYRRILIPHDLAEKIRKQGYAYKGNANLINERLHKFQDDLGIPRFRLHMLRHFCVAYLHKAGFTDQQILSYGGWSNSSTVMKRAYRYNLDPEESQKAIADTFSSVFNS